MRRWRGRDGKVKDFDVGGAKRARVDVEFVEFAREVVGIPDAQAQPIGGSRLEHDAIRGRFDAVDVRSPHSELLVVREAIMMPGAVVRPG